MTENPWFEKAERHMDVCEIYFDLGEYSHIINSCFLAMYSVIKALLELKNQKCKTLEGLVYLFKISYVDDGSFDVELFKFYCRTKELNTEFFRFNYDFFNEEMARGVFEQSRVFIDYSKKSFLAKL